MDQYASKVVEKCLKIGGNEFLDRYLDRVCEGRSDRPRIPLIDSMFHLFCLSSTTNSFSRERPVWQLPSSMDTPTCFFYSQRASCDSYPQTHGILAWE